MGLRSLSPKPHIRARFGCWITCSSYLLSPSTIERNGGSDAYRVISIVLYLGNILLPRLIQHFHLPLHSIGQAGFQCATDCETLDIFISLDI